MQVPAEHVEPVRFDLPVPLEFRIGGFGLIAFFLGIEFLACADVGMDRLTSVVHQNPAAISLIFAAEILLPLGFVFPPRRFLARLELVRDRIRYVADLRARIVAGESTEHLASRAISPYHRPEWNPPGTERR